MGDQSLGHNAVTGVETGLSTTARTVRPGKPLAHGLFDPKREHDACGVGFVARMSGEKSHDIVTMGIRMLQNLEHRGAVGADPRAGDGAGMLVQIPHPFFVREAAGLDIVLPEPGRYAVGHIFMPLDADSRGKIKKRLTEICSEFGQKLLGWRVVPTDNSTLGESVKPSEPYQVQCFIERGAAIKSEEAFERRLYIIRKVLSNFVAAQNDPAMEGFYVVSLSCRTITYKGMFLADQLATYYPDLSSPDFASALALVHQRFSTNTFPAWPLAHPYRLVAHNGEINTLRGNVNWMAARQATMSSEKFGDTIDLLWPISYEGQSDTACFDNALEFLIQGGYSLAHAMMVLIPEAWTGNKLMDDGLRAFYEYHAAIMEPWDGPAAVAFSDGRQIGATLDRNGLRPARYFVTDDGLVVMSSEMGALPIEESRIIHKWRLQPGRMLLIDLEKGRIIDDEEVKKELASQHPYRDILDRTQIILEEMPAMEASGPRAKSALLDLQQAFGYTQEDVKLLMAPMATTGQEAVGSMGTDTPISALSSKSKLLYTYFKQNFAQVTNPPIDPIREELVMSLVSMIGPRPNLLGRHARTHKRLEVSQPVLTNAELEKIRSIEDLLDGSFRTATIDTTWPAAEGAAGLEEALDRICAEATDHVLADRNILILSDRAVSPERVPIPALLATAAVHHHLIRRGLRTQTGLVIESGEVREVHHFCCLAGYGAEAVNPYLAFETLEQLRVQNALPLKSYEVQKSYIKAIGKGLLKVMSKMGISTYQSYCGAQIFDAVGLHSGFVEKYFTGTATTIEGAGWQEIAEETVRRHNDAYGDKAIYSNMLDPGGDYAFRLRGEDHAWTPESVARLQHAVRGNSSDEYKAFATSINEQSERLLTIRGLMQFKWADKPIPVEEVEPAANIVRRFATGAMSFGSISREAHTTLAIAMNRIGGKSNTGEGGEEADRFKPLPNGDSMRSAIKQVASGRFGVSAEYLVNADDLQIKMAQGAKPGEGGQLPGHKV
ncbi:glutamate synthase central domain-containing protein, partial [Candidatus Raskinella chloraquaticus]|uniref:glutamate synthase central domain-containing protein n=1 Tax=Candidatus Raskinella chloraquaticus TaxID=1951219 RepID=UPI003670FBD1